MRLFGILFFCCLLGQSAAFSQASFNFEHTSFDFGVVKEENGPVTHRFAFTNQGDTPLIVKGVKSSCGCTTPDWTREPVAPGEKGYIIARYDPRNRPGAFRKSMHIQSNAPNSPTIFISGTVQSKPRSIADEFPNKLGNLRSRYRTMNIGRITTEKPVIKPFELYNDSDKPIVVKGFVAAPHIKLDFQPDTISPRSKADMLIVYDAKARNDFGFVADMIKIQTNDPNMPEKSYRVVAVINEYFPPMTPEELNKAPRLTFDKKRYDFGTIEEGAQVKASFVLTNTGKQTLNIRNIKTSCGCIVANLGTDTLKPSSSTTLEITFDATARRGNQIKSITVFSNDPATPTQKITLLATINEQ